jgi:hypothetical protein
MIDEVDPWVLPAWTATSVDDCDGCGRDHVPVMRVRGGVVAMCRRCHRAFMKLWRIEDELSERDENVSDGLYGMRVA